MQRSARAVLVAMAVLGGCSKTPAAQAPALPRYWLANTILLVAPHGAPAVEVIGPVLVELSPDATVRGVEPGARAIAGYLPASLLTEPGKSRGLMLYAQRTAAIRKDAPDGPVLGELRKGALVSVVPDDSPEARIHASPFGDAALGYVRRDALGPAPQSPEPFKQHGRGRAVRLPGAALWVDGKHAYDAIGCHDLWVDEATGQATQHARGVVLTGSLEGAGSWSRRGASLYESASLCPARTLSMSSAGLVLQTPGFRLAEVVQERVSAAPTGFAEVRPPQPDTLRNAIDQRRSVFWVRETEGGLVCDEWVFQASPARLVRREPMQDEQGKTRPWYAYTYEAPHDGAVAKLHLDTIQARGVSLMKCECRHDYALVAANGEELHLMLRRMPEHAVAYAQGDAERWYLSAAACEAGRAQMASAIEQDGALAPYVGLHAVIAALGF